jgi:hypothetical protein
MRALRIFNGVAVVAVGGLSAYCLAHVDWPQFWIWLWAQGN